ncbi:MAG TPA: MFS transporter [Verrucomicrobiae bacterium]
MTGRKTSWRWLIALALFLAALLNYLDRNVLGLLAVTIQQDLNISNQQYAGIINCFLVAYTLANLLSGRVVDKLGVRLSLALFLVWWTAANALTGFSRNFWQLCGLRFMLGLGEAGCYTASPKAVAEWFPVAERGLVVGMYSAGGAVGATVAPVIVALVATHYGWRWAFAVTPILAVLWLVLWFGIYRRAGTLAPPAATVTPPALPSKPVSEWTRWAGVLQEPAVWLLMLARLITDPVWYFFQFWLPKYLQNARGLDQQGLANMWLIFAGATAGFLLGGYISGRLIRGGTGAAAARIGCMAVGAALVPWVALVPGLSSTTLVIGLAVVVAAGATMFLGNITSLVVDILPRSILGTAFGVIACGSALGGFFMNKTVAWMIDHHSYDACFYALGVVHPLALILVWRLRRRAVAD